MELFKAFILSQNSNFNEYKICFHQLCLCKPFYVLIRLKMIFSLIFLFNFFFLILKKKKFTTKTNYLIKIIFCYKMYKRYVTQFKNKITYFTFSNSS